MIAVDSRDYVTITKGKAYDIFDDAAVEYVEDAVVDYLHDDDWKNAGAAYYTKVKDVLGGSFVSSGSGAGSHTYNDRSSDGPNIALDLVIAIVLGFAISGFMCKTFYDQMKTAKEKTEANDYAQKSTFKLTGQSDTFVRSAITKTPKPKDNDHGGGGGGGFGGSGGGKF